MAKRMGDKPAAFSDSIQKANQLLRRPPRLMVTRQPRIKPDALPARRFDLFRNRQPLFFLNRQFLVDLLEFGSQRTNFLHRQRL